MKCARCRAEYNSKEQIIVELNTHQKIDFKFNYKKRTYGRVCEVDNLCDDCAEAFYEQVKAFIDGYKQKLKDIE